ncbi:MAG: hypothetical protein JNK76_00250 [Planctomycetales bacterium]|nr:hypothetical protein [Planctomycetales bacterium]MBN8626757.1 hypothetical protein [Planctomycetota bacterium]
MPGQPIPGGQVPGAPFYGQSNFGQQVPGQQVPGQPPPGPVYPAAQYPQMPGVGGPFPVQQPQFPQQYPAQAFPQAPMPGVPQVPGAQYPYPQAPYGAPQYPTAPQYPAAPQLPGAPQFPGAAMPGAPQFPTPAQYQGGFATPPPAAPQYPGAPQYPATPGYPQMPAAPQYTAAPAYPSAPQFPGAPVPNTVPSGFPQMPGSAAPTAPRQPLAPQPAPPPQSAAAPKSPTAPKAPAGQKPPVQQPAAKAPAPQRSTAPAGSTSSTVPNVPTIGPPKPATRSADKTFSSGNVPSASVSGGPPNFRGLVGSNLSRGEGLPEPEIVSAAELARKNAIPLLVSFIVHLAVIIVLGLLTVPEIKRNRVIIQASIDQPPPPSFSEIRGLAASMDAVQEESFRPLARLPQLPTAVNVKIVPMGVGQVNPSLVSPSDALPSALAGRGMKGQLLGEKGGTIQTEEAVEAGLRWLATHQLQNGMWSLTGTQRGPGAYSKGANFENNEAATAMALLAFFGAGHTPKNNSPHSKVIDKGIKALLRGQDASGNMFHGPQKDDLLYTNALCTMALCEYLALEPTASELRAPCEKALKYCLDTQSDSGGWKYTPRLDSDTSVTGWMLMAMQSAKNAQINVPQENFDKITAYFDAVAKGPDLVDPRLSIIKLDTPGAKPPTVGGAPLGSRYGYMIGENFDPVMTAEGLLCRMYLGWSPDDERLRNGVEYLLAEYPPLWDNRDVYYWYYGTQLMFHMEGDYWKQWNALLRDKLVERQEKTGPERGSWFPNSTGVNANGDEIGGDTWSLVGRGGRLYVTCFSLYMLEVYYRHLPLYSELKKQMEARQRATDEKAAAPTSGK